MSTRAELLDAIRANPAEDTPRLMYADWLDEQGTETDARRAAFIRDHIGRLNARRVRRFDVPLRARGPSSGSEKERWVVMGSRTTPRRSADFLNDILPAPWSTDWRTDFTAYVRRGLIDALTCPPEWWLKHGASILAEQPLARVGMVRVPDGWKWEHANVTLIVGSWCPRPTWAADDYPHRDFFALSEVMHREQMKANRARAG